MKGYRRRQPPRIRRLTSPGATPGTVEVPEDAPRPNVHVIRYTESEIREEDLTDIGELPGLLSEAAVTWVNVDGLGDAGTLRQLGKIFGLHELALEDVVNLHQRAKVEEYPHHLFIVMRMLYRTENVESEQLSLFLGQNFVLTFQERPADCLEPVRDRLRRSRGRIRESGPDYLAYAVIDAVVDAYFPVVDHFGDEMERLDDEVSLGRSGDVMEEVHNVRSGLISLRRAIRPLRDALTLLMPDAHSLIRPETQFFLRDCYDHVVQVLDLLDTYREMCSDLRDFYMSTINNRMNEIMKVLTIIATIFIPLSFISGVYGMNFNTDVVGNMPELNWRYGYVWSLLLMAGIAIGLLFFIWRKGWLNSTDR